MKQVKAQIRYILIAAVFIIITGTLFMANIIIPKPDILLSERRIPTKLPQLSAEFILSGDFAGRFDDWAADSFVMRDELRAVNTFLRFDIYRQTDKSGFYRDDAVGLGRFKQIDRETLEAAASNILHISEALKDYDMNMYYSIIPDKSEYAQRSFPGFTVSTAESVFAESFSGVLKYIDITDTLGAGSYYKTDLHWDQIKLSATAERLITIMDTKCETAGFSLEFAPKNIGAFEGVYAGQLARNYIYDEMNYIDLPEVTVSYIKTDMTGFTQGSMYDREGFAGLDPYDFFLHGPQPVVIMENPDAPQRELYVFRDSFSSSLAPLLTNAYSKITLIDLRYINLGMLERLIDFNTGSDVLFIYSSQILGNPGTF